MTDKEKDELIKEKASLEKYLKKLTELIRSEKFKTFGLMKQDNSKVQLEAMTVYLNVLKKRIEEVE